MSHPENKARRKEIGDKKAMEAFKSYYPDDAPENSPGRFGVLRDTRKLCSCPVCCGNPRRTRGRKRLTLQEMKIDQSGMEV